MTVPLSDLALSAPLPQASVSPPPAAEGGGKHSLAGEGGSQFGRLERKPGILSILWSTLFQGEHRVHETQYSLQGRAYSN